MTSGSVGNVTIGMTLYQRIASDLRTQIAGGVPVPGVSELARQYECTRPTVRNALRLLRDEGLLGADGKVIEFKRIPLRVSAEETITLIEDVLAAGHVLGAAQITVKLDGGTLVREVYRDVDGKPYTWAEWRFPLEVAEKTRLAYNRDVELGTIRYLKEGLGWTVTQETPYYDPRPPTARERMVLPVPGWVLAEHRAGTMEHPEMGVQRFSAVRLLDAPRTRLVP